MPRSRSVAIWDLPTRIFHWALALCVVFSWVTGQWGGSDWREWHIRSGSALFALLIFRVLWGFAGARYARFASFPPAPLAAVRSLRRRSAVPGHSPAAALSVYAMLVLLAVQVTTGLFAFDGSFIEGPWARYASHATVAAMTSVHTVNRWLVAAVVALHLAVVATYAWRRDPLVTAIFSGRSSGLPATALPTNDSVTIRSRAAIFTALAAALTLYLTLH